MRLKISILVAGAALIMGGAADAETTSAVECSKPEYAYAARSALPRLLQLKRMSDEERQQPRLLGKPEAARNFDPELPISPTACVFNVASTLSSIEAGWSEGDITVTRTTDGAVKADRLVLPDYTAESVVKGLQKRGVWTAVLNDAQRYFAGTKLGTLSTEPSTVEALFGALSQDGEGYIGGRLIFKFRAFNASRLSPWISMLPASRSPAQRSDSSSRRR
ncbi:hypothetical protein J4G43_003650 [Bradyrhizobium barranii subsp. barranii]|uniref:Uncharacterized protein n=1 Tax=Bradyrhizobium barranii subsp. barranii TaxID=2823807 RepID=A0A939S0G9_9BRAD|nr:hypothetical protein [Bradyrhizobium barranii]UEM13443.1 hypothetical protein J4G43_003650 [Bradyrhizobium barranii subsp. barranii]